MELSENNALRAAARAALKEVNAAWTAAGASGSATSAAAKQRDHLARQVLDKWEAKLSPRFSRLQLVYTIGVIKGTIKEK